MRNWLQGKNIVLTGASSGIGRELTKLLIQKYGANVWGIGRKEEKMQSLKQELGDDCKRFSYSLFDVSDKEAWQSFAHLLQESSYDVHVLINNAGVFPPFSKAENLTVEQVENVLKINFLATVYAINALSPLLKGDKKDKPTIVNVSSSAALCTIVGTAAYSASKAALKGYTEALQLDTLGEKYVGIIYPGTTATDLFASDENTKNSALDVIAMPASKMAKKLARKILKKRKRAVLGWDAKLMNFTAKVAPITGLRIIRWVMKKSGSKVFTNVFKS